VRRRIHAVELEDQDWLPDFLRCAITDVLHAGHTVFRLHQIWTPLIAGVLERTGETRLVDLCTGGSGPVPAVVDQLRAEHGLSVTAVLTDLYPNQLAISRINGPGGPPHVTYLERPVDAADVPEDLEGVRTMFASFHHMRPAAGRAILADAFFKRKAICIFEFTNNSVIGVLSYLVMPLVTMALTPLVRPVSAKRLALTYLVPLIPLLVTGDGMASHLRTYSPAELLELVQGLDAEDYRWEAGDLRHWLVPYRVPYLIGCPLKLEVRAAYART
jgi:hypothetical protein